MFFYPLALNLTIIFLCLLHIVGYIIRWKILENAVNRWSFKVKNIKINLIPNKYVFQNNKKIWMSWFYCTMLWIASVIGVPTKYALSLTSLRMFLIRKKIFCIRNALDQLTQRVDPLVWIKTTLLIHLEA